VTDRWRWFVGIDWGSEVHAICLVDHEGIMVEERTIAHEATAVHAWIDELLTRVGDAPDTIAVAIETPRHLLVETLLEYGLAVFAINPKQLDRFRDRFTVAGAKDDRLDARVLATSVRTDRHAFRRVRRDDPIVIELREYSRLVENIDHEHRRLANQLREQLVRIVPGWLTLCAGADEPWFWALLETAMTPTGPRRVSTARLARLLKTHHIRRWTATEVADVVHARGFVASDGLTPAVHGHIALLLPRLGLLRSQRLTCEARLDVLLARLSESSSDDPRRHRDAVILRSLPGVGRLVSATMLAEAAQALAERDYGTLRSYAGVAPVTERSGKRFHVVKFRRACHPRLRQALYYWSQRSLALDPRTRAYYRALRQRGHGHARALRSVADRWLRILIAMLRTGTIYDDKRFRPAIEEAIQIA